MHKNLYSRMVKLGSIATVGVLFGSGCSLDALARLALNSLGGAQGLVDLVLGSLLPAAGA